METTTLDKTGLEISRLGIGLSEIGSILSDADAKTASDVLNAALDNGINFLDTAACYGLSEDFIGRSIAGNLKPFRRATASWTRALAQTCSRARLSREWG